MIGVGLPTALAWSFLPALALLLLVWWVDRYEREPIRLFALALLFGAVAAPTVAALLEDAFGIRSSLYASDLVPRSVLTAWTPVVEEVVRAGAIAGVLLFVRREIDGLLDGFVYGAAVGVGFGLAANFWSILQTGTLIGEVNEASLFVSTLASVNHLFYGALIGLALAAAWRRSAPAIVAAGAAGTAAAIGLHIVHDYLPWWIVGDVTGTWRRILVDLPNGLGLLGLAILMTWAAAREKLIVARELREEVSDGFVTREEYAAVTDSFRKLASLAAALGRGARIWRLQRRLYALEVELAFRKYHARRGTPRAERLPDEDGYRARIATTRRELAAAAASPA